MITLALNTPSEPWYTQAGYMGDLTRIIKSVITSLKLITFTYSELSMFPYES